MILSLIFKILRKAKPCGGFFCLTDIDNPAFVPKKPSFVRDLLKRILMRV